MSDATTTRRPILVAVDFSPCSAAALQWAAKAARCFDTPLEILHVVHDPARSPGYYRKLEDAAPAEQIEEAAARRMNKFLKKVAKRTEALDLMSVQTRLIRGLPVNRILEAAADIDAQLIVMGTQGRTGLPHLMLGSKAERVAQLSPIPVTVVKAAQTADSATG